MQIFYDAQDSLLHSLGLFLLKIKLIQAFMVVLVTCKNEEDQIKNEGTRVVITLSINFQDAQG